MRILFALLLAMATTSASAAACGTLIDHTVKDILGTQENLCQYAGKVVLVVNTASYCGYTPQYKGLQALNEKYKARGLVILGFPRTTLAPRSPAARRRSRISAIAPTR
jgi:glutathione peroxidase